MAEVQPPMGPAKQGDYKGISVTGWLYGIVEKNIIPILVAGGLSVVGTFAWFVWTVSLSSMKSFIIETTVEELNRDYSRYLEPIKRTVERFRQSEVGALTVGTFTLTPAASSFDLNLYVPAGNTAELRLTIKNNDPTQRWYAVLVFPDRETRPLRLKNEPQTIDLVKYFSKTEHRDGFEDEVVRTASPLKGLRSVTFQLRGTDTSNSTTTNQDIAISINYVALVSPAIYLERQ